LDRTIKKRQKYVKISKKTYGVVDEASVIPAETAVYAVLFFAFFVFFGQF